MAANTPNIFVYTVAYDDGFAPNPFHGVCSLATCKPSIRKAAGLGDLVVGKAGVPDSHRAVFVMQVDEILTYDQYWRDPRFVSKKPVINGSLMMACGDNIYHRATPDGKWIQAHSYHSNRDGTGQPDNVRHDTGRTDQVLLSRRFKYFGANGPDLPKLRDQSITAPIRNMLRHFSDRDHQTLMGWLGSLKGQGLMYEPSDWQRLQLRD